MKKVIFLVFFSSFLNSFYSFSPTFTPSSPLETYEESTDTHFQSQNYTTKKLQKRTFSWKRVFAKTTVLYVSFLILHYYAAKNAPPPIDFTLIPKQEFDRMIKNAMIYSTFLRPFMLIGKKEWYLKKVIKSVLEPYITQQQTSIPETVWMDIDLDQETFQTLQNEEPQNYRFDQEAQRYKYKIERMKNVIKLTLQEQTMINEEEAIENLNLPVPEGLHKLCVEYYGKKNRIGLITIFLIAALHEYWSTRASRTKKRKTHLSL